MRHGLDLCPQELEFINTRKQTIMQTMQSRFGEEVGPKVIEEVKSLFSTSMEAQVINVNRMK